MLDDDELRTFEPGALQEIADGGRQLELLETLVHLPGHELLGLQCLQARGLSFREPLDHALRAGFVAVVRGLQFRGDGAQVGRSVLEPLQRLLHGALDPLLQHLSGPIQARLPAHGALLQGVHQLVQRVGSDVEEAVVIDRDRDRQGVQFMDVLPQRTLQRVGFLPVAEGFADPHQRRVVGGCQV